MADPPVVKLPPDGAGHLLKTRTHADGRQEALVAWIAARPGPRGGLADREEWLPPVYRGHQLVHDPYVLAWMAACHVAHAQEALRSAYRSAAVDLKPFLPPHVIADVLDTYRAEGRRLADTAASIQAIAAALQHTHPR